MYKYVCMYEYTVQILCKILPTVIAYLYKFLEKLLYMYSEDKNN